MSKLNIHNSKQTITKNSLPKVKPLNLLLKSILILIVIGFASLFFVHNKAYAYSSPDPDSGVSFSPRAFGIPQFGSTDYTVSYTNNSAKDIKDIAFGPGGTTGLGPSFVQIVSFSGCDSVNISAQGDLGYCYISIPVGASKTITVTFSNGGWGNGNGTGNEGWNYVPASADFVDGTSVGVTPYTYMSTPIVNPFSGVTINTGDTYTANGSFSERE